MLTTGFWDKIGLSWDEVHTSANATLWTGTLDYTPEQWARVQNVLDRIYNDFTSKVAQGRGFSHEKALEVAKGRIWTGEDAQALNLVDELGGFPVALRLAKKAAGIPEDVTIRLKVFPPQKTFLQALAERLLGEDKSSNEEEASTAALTRVLRMLQPLVRLARELGLGPTPGALTMPELEVVQ
jgi:protease-4